MNGSNEKVNETNFLYSLMRTWEQLWVLSEQRFVGVQDRQRSPPYVQYSSRPPGRCFGLLLNAHVFNHHYPPAAPHALLQLLARQFRKLFGSYNFGQMIETSYLSVSALSAPDLDPGGSGGSELLVGFAILSDTPRAGVSEDWLEWFSETHAPADTEVTMTNTLWVDFAVAVSPAKAAGRISTSGGAGGEEGDGCIAEQNEEEEAAAGVIEDIVRTVFNTLPEIDYLVMSLPGEAEVGGGGGNKSGKRGAGTVNVPTPAYLLRAFEVLGRHVDASPNNLDEAYGKPLLLLCDRMAFLPTLAVSTRAGCRPL